MEQITFDTMPQAIASLTEEVKELKQMMLARATELPNQTDRWFNLEEFGEYHPDKPTKATVYAWVSAGVVPVHKSGKRLRFLKSEIDAWLQQGKRKTQSELQVEADSILSIKSKGGKP